MNADSAERILDSQAIKLAMETWLDALLTGLKGHDINDIALIGLQTRGVTLAKRLGRALEARVGVKPLLGKLDISMYRDDIGMREGLPAIRETRIAFDVNERVIVLVDDVLFTGRTARAALDAVTDYGRPALIRLAVLVDRGHREYPIQADYVGVTVDAPRDKRVYVELNENDNGGDAVYAG